MRGKVCEMHSMQNLKYELALWVACSQGKFGDIIKNNKTIITATANLNTVSTESHVTALLE